jgi:predicted NBD/HSP70 family sugar kinase
MSRGEAVSTRELLELTASGDPAASRLIGEAGREIGVALAGLVNLVNPSCVIIGGDLSAAGELITEPVLESIRRYAIASAAEQVSVVAGVLGERAELLGALALVLHASEGVLGAGPPAQVAA